MLVIWYVQLSEYAWGIVPDRVSGSWVKEF